MMICIGGDDEQQIIWRECEVERRVQVLEEHPSTVLAAEQTGHLCRLPSQGEGQAEEPSRLE